MKVLYIADRGDEGGAARAIVEVVTNLRALGVVPVVCTGIPNKLNEQFTELGIENFASYHFPAMNPKSPYKWKRPLKFPLEVMKYNLSIPVALKNIRKHIDLSTIDIIHTNSARNDIGCILSKKYKIPHVMHIREFGQEDFSCNVYKFNFYEFISRYTSRFLAVSRAVANSWIKKGINAQITQVVPDGVVVKSILVGDPARFAERSELKMIIAGGVIEPKGQHIAIEAITLLPDEIRSNITLDIAGWGDPRYFVRLEKLIEQHKLKNINFLGVREDLYQIYKNYDIGLMCSRSEGFGRVTAEYLYAGLGVIACDTGASPELVKADETGLIYRQDSPESLARCIEKFYRDRELLKKYAMNAHEDAKARFSAERNARDILKVYEEILNRSI